MEALAAFLLPPPSNVLFYHRLVYIFLPTELFNGETCSHLYLCWMKGQNILICILSIFQISNVKKHNRIPIWWQKTYFNTKCDWSLCAPHWRLTATQHWLYTGCIIQSWTDIFGMICFNKRSWLIVSQTAGGFVLLTRRVYMWQSCILWVNMYRWTCRWYICCVWVCENQDITHQFKQQFIRLSFHSSTKMHHVQSMTETTKSLLYIYSFLLYGIYLPCFPQCFANILNSDSDSSFM